MDKNEIAMFSKIKIDGVHKIIESVSPSCISQD